MHEKTDVTSARHIVSPPALRWRVDHLRIDRAGLLAARRELGFPEPGHGPATSEGGP